MATAVKRDMAERHSTWPGRRMTENRAKDCLGLADHPGSWLKGDRLISRIQWTSAHLHSRTRRVAEASCHSAMMFAIAAAAGRQSLISRGGEHRRADQRYAERSHQQGCPDATHHCKCTPASWFFPSVTRTRDCLECRWSDVGERIQYNPPWIQDASRDVDRTYVSPVVLRFTRISSFVGSE